MTGPDGHTKPSIDLPSWIAAVLALDPTAPALQFEGTWRTWAWISDAVGALRPVLERFDLREAVKIGVLMRNRPEIVRTVAASLATRSCLVTLSSAIPAAKLSAEIEGMRLPVVIASEDDWIDDFRRAVTQAGSFGIAAADGDIPFRVVVSGPRRVLSVDDVAPGVAIEMLTSGTTGPPKRIDLTYRGLEYEIESTAKYSASDTLVEPRLSSGTSLIWSPLLHIGGLRGLMTALVAGRKIALLERFSVERWAALVREHRPKMVSLVPATVAMVYDADLPREVFDSVRAVFCGTAPLDPEMARQFEERYGVPILVVYGATEFAGGIAGWTLSDWQRYGADKVGSVGRPNAGVRARIVDENSGQELPRGEVGLLEVQAHQLGRDGWVRTTDLARMDGDDFIWIVGRADDVIVRGGFKVSTTEVRDAIVAHPAVQDAAVIGVPDRRLGQVPVAAVELRPGAAPVTADELVDWMRERLTGYQVPVEVRILDALPRTPSMKVSHGALRPLFAKVV